MLEVKWFIEEAQMAMTDNIPYAPLVMSQKVAPRKHTMYASCVLPRKVDKTVWIFGEIGFEENNVCFLVASYYIGKKEAHIVAY